ncbi:magnesium/cobalt transporter CorA [candidate division KSB1 bacterium]|nr:magnesium/cobalt transporter CorA [candidate division KSB1 bacterium]
MLKLIKKSARKLGLAPGTLVLPEEKPPAPMTAILTLYDAGRLEKQTLEPDFDLLQIRNGNIWLHLNGIHDLGWIEKIGESFQLHPLVLEDILNTAHRPKLEDYDDYLYFVGKLVNWDAEKKELVSEQISLVLGKDFVVSFSERENPFFDHLLPRMQRENGRLRKAGVDYLFYALVDLLVDRYFLTLEQVGIEIEEVEDEMMTRADPGVLYRIHRLKRELLFFLKSVWPMREAVLSLDRMETPLINETTRPFLRDLYDHAVQVIDTLESYRELTTALLDTLLTLSGNRMNEVMKVLTIIATIFIPLTFIAGIYGMNFKNMPELSWPWGYFAVWGVMVGVAMIMLIYFKRKKWL